MSVPFSSSQVDALEDAYWVDPGATELRARELLRTRDDLPEPLRMRLVILMAKFTSRRGDHEAAVGQLQSIRRWALQHDETQVLARCERVLATVFDQIGDAALALEHAAAANAAVTDTDSLTMQAAVRLCLADALGTGGTQHEARPHYDRADLLARRAGVVQLQALILNNRAYSEHLTGYNDLALVAADRLVAVLDAAGVEPAVYMRDTLAVVWLAAGQLDAAADILSIYAEPEDVPELDVDAAASGLLVLARLNRERGDLGRAATFLHRAQDLFRGPHSPSVAADGELEQAELLAARGDFRGAYEAYKGYHAKVESLRATEREARGRVLHVLFEADEARRDRELYRNLSERDPLTGLFNRRQVDQVLPAMIARAHEPGRSLVLAFVDLDRFKTINDQFSHQIGDEVLRTVATILLDFANQCHDGLAARMGGEEFLLALPGLDEQAGRVLLNDVRGRLAGHAWCGLAPGLSVTASIGAAVAPGDGAEHAALLRIADERLYKAKHNGRNQVVLGTAEPADRAEPAA